MREYAVPEFVSRYLNAAFGSGVLPNPLSWRNKGESCYLGVYERVVRKLRNRQWVHGKAAMVTRLFPDYAATPGTCVGILAVAACLEILNGETV